jgi:hypothetical protein
MAEKKIVMSRKTMSIAPRLKIVIKNILIAVKADA